MFDFARNDGEILFMEAGPEVLNLPTAMTGMAFVDGDKHRLSVRIEVKLDDEWIPLSGIGTGTRVDEDRRPYYPSREALLAAIPRHATVSRQAMDDEPLRFIESVLQHLIQMGTGRRVSVTLLPLPPQPSDPYLN